MMMMGMLMLPPAPSLLLLLPLLLELLLLLDLDLELTTSSAPAAPTPTRRLPLFHHALLDDVVPIHSIPAGARGGGSTLSGMWARTHFSTAFSYLVLIINIE